MQVFLSAVSRAVRARESTGLLIVAPAVLLTALAVAALAPTAATAHTVPADASSAVRIASSAHAATADPGQLTPSATSTSTPATTPTAPAPTPSAPRLDPLPTELVTRLPLTVSGTADPGDVLDISAGSSTSADSSCAATAGDGGRWSCAIRRLPDGPRIPVRAVSRTSGLSANSHVDVLSPPAITTLPGTTTGGGIRGTAYPGATVTVTAETGANCSFPVDGHGAWGCVLTGVTDGRHTITATQVAPFSSGRSTRSAAVDIVLDTAPPAAPTITSPPPGAIVSSGAVIVFGGIGESRDVVSVYAGRASGTTVACSATVSEGAWSCRAVLPFGRYTASALQRDAAGNVSAGSNPVTVTVEAAAPIPPSEKRRSSPTPTPTVPAPAAPDATAAPQPAPAGSEAEDWVDTSFTTATAPLVTAASVPVWLRSIMLSVSALLLLMLPARLLAATLTRGRARGSETARPGGSGGSGRLTLFGRNRPRAELSEADSLLGDSRADSARPAWLIPLAAIMAAAALITLSTTVQDATAYLRLVIAVTVAVAAVNTVWVLSARGMARHLGRSLPAPVVQPLSLVVIAAAALGSRLLGMEPALLFGIVLGVLLPDGLHRAEQGRIAMAQLSAVAALGVLSWLTIGVLPAPSGAVSAFFVELANALALIGIGSAAIGLLPLGGLAGRAVFQWSRTLWAGLSLIVYTVLFALLLPVASLIQTGTAALTVALAAFAFAALSVSVWLWERYIEPAR